ncbi:MAG: ABC transporter ATP-binding protein [Candidatus Hodarchaeaceae archaeon]|nr:ABC transporter ATP-binding protein [Candidatus Hodarchaeaceae archaeon]
MIKLQGLTRKFNGLVAVDGLTFEVGEGEIFGLLGPNGAGKTTTVRMLCCLIKPTGGKAFVGGYEVGKDALRVREIVGLLPEAPGLYGELSAYRNLEFYAKLYGVPKRRREENIERFLKMLGLWGRRDDPVATFSRGMQQKLAIVRAMVHEPKVLFLDEPTAALAPESAKTVRDFILELKQERRTIFLCTHNLHEAERLCDRVAITNSKLIAIGSPSELEQKFGPSRTEIRLERVSRKIVDAVRRLKHVKGVEVVGDKLMVEVEDPEAANPVIVEAVVKHGGRVRYVARAVHALEETYLRLVRESEA